MRYFHNRMDQQQSNGISVRAAAFGSVLIVVISFIVGAAVGSSRSASAAAVMSVTGIGGLHGVYTQPDGIDLSPVWKAWYVIDERYVAPHVATSSTLGASSTPNGFSDPQERVWGMLEGLAASIGDPYTVFMPPVQAQIFQEDISGDFEGVGMEIAVRDSILTVVSPLKDSPAQKAGLKAMDKILEIDGVDTKGTSVEEAVKRIRGKKGTEVKFKIYREGATELLDIAVIRDVINIPTIETEKRPDGIFLIQLYNFSAVSSGLFRDSLREFLESGFEKLILDLRGNPGGYLEASVEMASWFLPAGAIVVTEDYAERQSDIVHRSRGYDVFSDSLQMVILVDKGSASASEILAGALKHHGVAKLLGTNTFGKGSVQELVPITPETSLKLTVARWLNPGGLQIPIDGIAPDIMATTTEAFIKEGRDVQLEKAVEVLGGTNVPAKK